MAPASIGTTAPRGMRDYTHNTGGGGAIQPELFIQEQVGNVTREVPMTVGRIAFAPLPDMMGQPPAQNVPTSLAAADRVRDLPKTKRDEVLLSQWMEFRGCLGATDDEIKEHFGWDGDYERPRRWTLVKHKKVFASEKRRKTKDGNAAIVWMRAL